MFWENGEIKDLKEIRKFLSLFRNHFLTNQSKISPELFAVSLFLLEESIDLYESIIILRTKGRFLPCLVLARSILENCINIQYIYREDTERRARNFHAFPLREYLRRAESMNELPEKGVEMLRRMQEEIKSYNPTGDNPYHWDGKSINKIFTELNLKDLYTSLYARLSGFSHAQFGNRNFQQDRPYINFLKNLNTKSLFVVTLESVRVITEHLDMLPLVVRVSDFPQKGAVLFFSTHPKKTAEGY